MIVKSFLFEKFDHKNYKFFLLYGKNNGLKNDLIKTLVTQQVYKENYYENEILENLDNFFNSILSQSFFEKEKIIIIKKTTDKMMNVIKEIIAKSLNDLKIILDSDELTKKSKIRQFFEKNDKVICTPVYEDNYKSLNIIIKNFLNEKKYNFSNECINLLIDRSKYDRHNLKIELEKIDSFAMNKKQVTFEEVQKITNLFENYDATELVNACLIKDKKKLLKIMNENNFNNEDIIIILRTFLLKTKRLFLIRETLKDKNKIDQAIASYKPPIFWKEKDIVKTQLKIWSKNHIIGLMKDIMQTEYLVKKNGNSSLHILMNFMFDQVSETNN